MDPEVEIYADRLRDYAESLLTSVASQTEAARWGEFSIQKLAATIARRGADEWNRWGRARRTSQDESTFFAACARAARNAFWSAARSPKVECVQVAGLRRCYEPMVIGRNWFPAELWVQLDRMLIEGLDKIDQELLTWTLTTKVPFTPTEPWHGTSGNRVARFRSYRRSTASA